MNISEYLASLKQVSSQWIVAAVKYQIMVLWVKIDSKLLKKFSLFSSRGYAFPCFLLE